MKTEEKNTDIALFYNSLSRKDKGRFVLWVQFQTGYSQSTVFIRLRNNSWNPMERRCISEAIDNDSWKT